MIIITITPSAVSAMQCTTVPHTVQNNCKRADRIIMKSKEAAHLGM